MFNTKSMFWISLCMSFFMIISAAVPLAYASGIAEDASNAYSSASKDISQVLDCKNQCTQFVTELKKTQTSIADLRTAIGADNETATEVMIRSKITDVLDMNVGSVTLTLKIIQKIVKILKAVSYVRKPMKVIDDKLEKAIKKLKKLDKKLRPIKNKTKKFRIVVVKGVSYRDQLISHSRTFDKVFTPNVMNKIESSANWIDDLFESNSPETSQTISDTEALTAELILLLIAVRGTVEGATYTVNKGSEVKNNVIDALRPVKNINSQMKTLKKTLKDVKKGMKAINKVFRKKIKVSFKYSSPTFSNPKRKKTASLGIRLEEIMQGPDAIQTYLEKQLGDAMWVAAKAFGVKKLIKRIQKKANKKMNATLKKYNLDFKVNIKGMKKLNTIEKKLDVLIKKAEECAKLPSFDVPKQADIDKLMRKLDRLEQAAKEVRASRQDIALTSITVLNEVRRDTETMLSVMIENKAKVDSRAVLTLAADDGFMYEQSGIIIPASGKTEVKIAWTPAVIGEVRVSGSVLVEDKQEKSLENNSAALMVDVTEQVIDLSVIEMITTDRIIEAEETDIGVVVANLNESDDTFAIVTITASDGFTYTSEDIVLLAGSQERIECEWTPGEIGSYELIAEVKIGKGAVDSAQENNKITKNVVVIAEPIDLSVLEIMVPDEIIMGEEQEIKATVRNNGAYDSTAPVEVLISVDDGYVYAESVAIANGQSKEIVCEWIPKRAEIEQITASIDADATLGERDSDNNKMVKTVEVKEPKPQAEEPSLKNKMQTAAEELLASGILPENIEDTKAAIRALIEKLKTSYSTGNQTSLMQLFSSQFPNYSQLLHALQNDVHFFRNMRLNYRIETLTVTPDESAAVAKVYWDVRFMLTNGRTYTKSSRITMHFTKPAGEWKIAAMPNNQIFGASLLSFVDLQMLLSGLNVTLMGSNIQVTGILVKNSGNALVKNFRVRFVYRRSSGQQYTAYATVGAIRPRSQTFITATIPATLFIIGPGDTLRIELDPDNTIAEFKVNNNVQTQSFPF